MFSLLIVQVLFYIYGPDLVTTVPVDIAAPDHMKFYDNNGI